MKNLLLTGETKQVSDWNPEDILTTDRYHDLKNRMEDLWWEEQIAKIGLTYQEIEELNNILPVK